MAWRRERDSNPRTLAGQRFSRPPQSTALPSLRRQKYDNFKNYKTGIQPSVNTCLFPPSPSEEWGQGDEGRKLKGVLGLNSIGSGMHTVFIFSVLLKNEENFNDINKLRMAVE